MDGPRLSVVVPVYNEAQTIGRCLGALRAQLRPGVEVIVADDGSTDGTADLVAAEFPELRLLRLPHRGGPAARRAAIEAARAPVIASLDADCVVCDGWVDAILARGAEGPVMGRVAAEPTFAGRLAALLQFGEFLGPRPRPLENFAFLNFAAPAAFFREHPIPLERHGADRLHSWRAAGAGTDIRFDPAQAVVHAPPLGLRAFVRRHFSYARRFVAIRRVDPTLPGGRLLRVLGAFAAPLLAAGRLVRDLPRLARARRPLGIAWYALPAYALALAALRTVDAVAFAREALPPLLRDTLDLGVSGVAGHLLHIARAFVGARVLGPASYGVWQGVRVALQAAQLSDLGSFDGFKRELPVAEGGADEARAAAVRAAAVLAGVLGAGLVAAGCLVVAAFTRGPAAPVLVAAAVAAVLQQAFLFGEATLRAEARMGRAATASFARAVTGAALAWPLAVLLGVEGFVGAIALGSAAGAAVALAGGPRRLRARPTLRALFDLVKTGLPIKIARTAPGLTRSADKVVVLALAGPAAAGLYGLADTVARLLGSLPGAATAAVAPHALRRYAETGDAEELFASLTRPLYGLGRAVPLLAGLAAVLSEPVIDRVLPEFTGAATVTKIFCYAMAGAGLEGLSRNLLVALGRQRAAAGLAVGFGAVAIGLDVAVLKLGLGIEGVAGVAVGTHFLLALTLAACACRWLDASLAALAGPLVRFAWGGAVLLAVELLLRDVLPGGVWGRAAAVAVLVSPTLRPPQPVVPQPSTAGSR